jgi:glycosyltransferase involved in cell wall biosynthesis
LKSITSQKLFKNTGEVEIVVSDNCSTDQTEKIVNCFLPHFEGKIIYSRNTEGIAADYNFEKALSLGRGDFLKLTNDTVLFNEGSLKMMLDFIKANIVDKPVIFFRGKNKHYNGTMRLNGVDAFVGMVSHNTTWIGSFGIWREEFIKINNFAGYASKCLLQVDIILRMVSEKKSAAVSGTDIFKAMVDYSRGNYNAAEVFGQNYLFLLKKYLASGELSRETYETEKKKLLKSLILPCYYTHSKEFINVKSGLFKYIWQCYKHNPYVYFYILRQRCKTFLKQAEGVFKILTRSKERRRRRLWRTHNKHNGTVAVSDFIYHNVSAGFGTTGELNINVAENGNVVIGDNVTIGKNVTFNAQSGLIIVEDGVKISDGTVIESGAIITKNI